MLLRSTRTLTLLTLAGALGVFGCNDDKKNTTTTPEPDIAFDLTTEDTTPDVDGEDTAEPPIFGFIVDTEFFSGGEQTIYDPWDVLVDDKDGDGDPDVLINWHHLERLELHENQDGTTLTHINPRGDDPTGLYDNAGIPELFIDRTAGLEAIPAEQPGIYLFHDLDRLGGWNVVVQPPTEGPGYGLALSGNVPLHNPQEGLAAGEFTRIDNKHIEIPASTLSERRVFRFTLNVIAHALTVEPLLEDGAQAPTLYVGLDQTPLTNDPITLTKPDPHGMVWADMLGNDARPDIFLTRGAVRGELVPPAPGKFDRIYEANPDGTYALDPDQVMPSSYGRGRQVALVNLDNAGPNELYVSNMTTPNAFFTFGPDGDGALRFEDRAPQLGLDLMEGFSFASLDVDHDGFEDIVYLDPGGAYVAFNEAGAGYRIEPGADHGIVLPGALEIEDEDPVRWDTPMFLHVADVDMDGQLDLWLTGFRDTNFSWNGFVDWDVALYRGLESGGFEDATEAFGLTDIGGFRYMLPGDFDNDGDVDGLAIGGPFRMLQNIDNARFEIIEPIPDFSLTDFTIPALGDINMDGWLDAVVIKGRRRVLRNTSNLPNTALFVELQGTPPPIGAIVRAYYSDGRVRAQRFGSHNVTRWSQALGPLHFGVPEGSTITEIGVSRPGNPTEQRVAVDAGSTRLVIPAP